MANNHHLGFRPQSQTDHGDVSVITFIHPDGDVVTLIATASGTDVLVHPDGYVELPIPGQPGSDLAAAIDALVAEIT